MNLDEILDGGSVLEQAEEYMAGHCHVMALALKKLHPDWQIRAHIGWDEESEDDEDYRVDHIYIVAPDGSAYDCRGKFNNEEELVGEDETGGVETQLVDYSLNDIKNDIARGELKRFSKQDLQNAIKFVQQQQSVAEGRRKKKRKSTKSVRGYFYPGYAYYGVSNSDEGGGDSGGESVNVVNRGVAEGFLNESAYEEAWELISQPVPEIQQFVKQLGLAQDDTTAKQIAPMIDATPDTQLPAASIPKLKNLANKGNDVQTLKAIQQISGRPDAAQKYAKIMQARDAGEGRQRGYDISGLINSVKSGNYEAPVLLKLATGTYVIGGRTRLYAALALGIPAKVKIISVSTFAKQGQQGVAEGFLPDGEYQGITMSAVEGEDGFKLTAWRDGTKLGFVEFSYDTDGTIRPEELEVYYHYRGQGIAKKMYDYVKDHGFIIKRSSEQTPDGVKFWDKNRPNERIWEQGAIGDIEHDQRDLVDVAHWMNTTPDNLSIEIRQEPIEKFIDQIREMYGTYDEFPEDEERTNRILKMLNRGAKPLPMYVEENDPDLFVMEGRHRMVAFWLKGMKTIPVAYVSVKDVVDEMALAKYQTFGDFEKPGPFRGADKRLIPHPKSELKTQKFFEKTPYDFRLFFSNVPGFGKYSEHGPMNPGEIRNTFNKEQADQILDGHDDAITVVFVGNRGDAKVMLTPWIMAHRFGHAIQAGVRRNSGWSAWAEAENHFFNSVNNILEEYYGKGYRGPNTYRTNIKWDMTPEYNALFNAIGTQRSSRTGKIRRPYEFLYEAFAQYLGTGKITFNPLPTNLGYGRKVFGNPTKYLNIKPEFREGSDRQDAADVLARDMELMFDDVLSSSVGQIFIM